MSAPAFPDSARAGPRSFPNGELFELGSVTGAGTSGSDLQTHASRSCRPRRAAPTDQEWGRKNDGGGKVSKSLKKSKTLKHTGNTVTPPMEEVGESDGPNIFTLLRLNEMGLDEECLVIGMRMIDSSVIEGLKERWRQLKERLWQLRLTELQIAADRAALMEDQAKLFLKVYRRAKAAGK